ncbi:hypothetical protein FACS1894116_03630 [Betaproteobacteria bacterium]|nr:hypothetical protein FACS1894116_03630 [Betaproteobacteria bacterium]GHU02330.1 hypothetical protein FACS1894154_12220 [Betaproteobacteria bacterium]GHU29205.1 hypothetical protein FACS189497_06700 [Betaproteobacteria bacterium]
MGAWERIRGWMGGGDKPARLIEAAGMTIDDDEEGWRRLSGDSARDLSPLSQARMRDTAYDTLCQRFYGHLDGTVEANAGLAKIPQPFDSGVLITLPELPVRAENTVRLWS